MGGCPGLVQAGPGAGGSRVSGRSELLRAGAGNKRYLHQIMGLVISLTSVATDCRREKGDLETHRVAGAELADLQPVSGLPGGPAAWTGRRGTGGGLWEEGCG